MQDDNTWTWTAAVIAAVVVGPSAPAWAETPAAGDELHAEDRVDHHHRPARYDDPNFAVPPASGADPDYPLAAGFVPADASNYTSGGINSYDYVVVHTMQGYYGGSISWFQNPAANVSAHYLMRAEDGEVTQMVREDDRAWHVGNSNSYALGIEHEGFIAEPEWYTWETYLSSARLTRWMCEAHSIPVDRDHVVGHVELPNQTHTDPGGFWDWDLYMALVRDVVPQGEVQGVVVDRGMACTITANADTWVKTTLESATDLDDTQRCMVPAGTSLTYLHASDEMIGHARLHFDLDGSPCAGGMAEQGFVFLEHFDATCDPAGMAAVGAEIVLDGGEPLVVDAEGRFTLTGVAPGAHTLDASAAEFVAGLAPFDVEVFPGARVVIGLDPVAGGDTGGDSTGGSEGGEGTTGARPGGTAGSDGDGPLPDDPSTGPDTGTATRALPPGFGEDEETGCGCVQGRPTAPAWLMAWLLLGLGRRRRR